MENTPFERSVFINCPFDRDYAPLLKATLFCVVRFGFTPFLANIQIESAHDRLNKIIGQIRRCRYSIHDLSRSQASSAGEVFRMNMPFEFGLDVGMRSCGPGRLRTKKFLVFERERFELKKALSDTGGQDPEFHEGKNELIVEKVRHFFSVEARVQLPGPSKVRAEYATFQAWALESRINQGFLGEDAANMPILEQIAEMKTWLELGRPSVFDPERV